MNIDKRNQYINEVCRQKNINAETRNYIKRYIQLNEKLFGNFLDIDEVTNNILTNLNHSITRRKKDVLKNRSLRAIFILLTSGGCYSREKHLIFINPKIYKNREKRLCATMHELDHCATAKDVVLTKQQIREIALYSIKMDEIKNPIRKKMRINKIYRDFEKDHRVLNITGISDNRQEAKNGIELRGLNEGITALKQEMYDKEMGIKHNTGYKYEKKVAKFIADIIGQEELLKLHFNNDYDGIRYKFMEKTGKDLNLLIEMLNSKPKFKIRYKFMKRERKKYFDEISEFSEKIEQHMDDIKPKGTKTDFIPKVDIDNNIELDNNIEKSGQLQGETVKGERKGRESI